MNPKFKEITDALREFLAGIDVDQKICIRGYPWLYILGKEGQSPSDYFPGFFIVPPGISTISSPIYGTVLSVTYPVYYVIRVVDNTYENTNPGQELEDVMTEVIKEFESNPQIDIREVVDYGVYNCSLENEMTYWARDLRQPYVALKFNFAFTVRMQREC